MQRDRSCFERLQRVKLSLSFKTWEGNEVRCFKFEETEVGRGILVLLFHVACLDIHVERLGGVQKKLVKM
jgi:hypothetical protein